MSKKEYRRMKTKLDFIEAVAMTMFYVGLAIYSIMK